MEKEKLYTYQKINYIKLLTIMSINDIIRRKIEIYFSLSFCCEAGQPADQNITLQYGGILHEHYN